MTDTAIDEPALPGVIPLEPFQTDMAFAPSSRRSCGRFRPNTDKVYCPAAGGEVTISVARTLHHYCGACFTPDPDDTVITRPENTDICNQCGHDCLDG